jgi:cyclic pyranopterin monophosphate synthase
MEKDEGRPLSHVDAEGRMRMVDVGEKEVTSREAVAEAVVAMSRETLRLVVEGGLPKGDVFAAAKVAGILAAKQTPALIPMTHPLPITFADVVFRADEEKGTITITTTVRCDAKTGVEIEAMTAASVAALTVYDMCKSAEKGIVIESIRLVSKSGGKSGTWER